MWRIMRRNWHCLGILVALFVISIYFYIQQALLLRNNSESNKIVNSVAINEYQAVYKRWRQYPGPYTGVKTILYWNTMYMERHRHFMFGVGDRFKKCKVPHCYATPDRKVLSNVDAFDAILFHGIEMDLVNLPQVRSSKQRYIFFSWESSLSRPINDYEFVHEPNFYNWTMSYRLDSDVRRLYGQIRDIASGEIVAPPRLPDGIVPWVAPEQSLYIPSVQEMLIINGKLLMVAWFVSHCKTNSKREDLAVKLSRHVQVDVYGKCGKLHCDIANTEECYDFVEKDYFFYLSFENTLCKDYVTEKLFLLMQRYVIPIVYGGADYTKFVPPHSYIDVNNFQTIKQLAEFLRNLANNPEAYASYFWWKKYYQVEDTTQSTLCDLCEKLHDTKLPKKSIENFENYYITNQCESAKLPHD